MEIAEKKPFKVGPFGSDNGGDRFDDGVHSSIRQLVICYSPSSIRYIQIEYDDNGKSYWSPKHGYSSPISLDKIESIKLDYPEEYLTSIHGYYRSTWYLPTYISSLTFTSNRKVYGPFGDYENEGRKYFTIQVSQSKIVGFHGRSDDWFDLRALGAYLKPLPQILPQYTNSNITPTPIQVSYIGYPQPLHPRPPYYGNYYTNPDPNYNPSQLPPQQAAPIAYPYGYYGHPLGHSAPYGNGYYDYQMPQAPVRPVPAAFGLDGKVEGGRGKLMVANNSDPNNVTYRGLGNEVRGSTGDHNGVFNVGDKSNGIHKEDDEGEEW